MSNYGRMIDIPKIRRKPFEEETDPEDDVNPNKDKDWKGYKITPTAILITVCVGIVLYMWLRK